MSCEEGGDFTPWTELEKCDSLDKFIVFFVLKLCCLLDGQVFITSDLLIHFFNYYFSVCLCVFCYTTEDFYFYGMLKVLEILQV